MKITVAVFVILVVSVSGQQYTSQFDNIDVEAILSNDRLLKNYGDCLLDRGKCTSQAAELKKNIPDALATGCSKCSDKHKAGVKRVIKYLSENRKDLWNELVVKYDPDGVYRKTYNELSRKENITV